jgi:hypothetical protein
MLMLAVVAGAAASAGIISANVWTTAPSVQVIVTVPAAAFFATITSQAWPLAVGRKSVFDGVSVVHTIVSLAGNGITFPASFLAVAVSVSCVPCFTFKD